MAKKFSEFVPEYEASDKDKEIKDIWNNSIICFDSNALLNIYSHNVKGRAGFLDMLKKIEDKMFVPHQVAVEFARNRVKRINGILESTFNLERELSELEHTIKPKVPISLHDAIQEVFAQACLQFNLAWEEIKEAQRPLLEQDIVLPLLMTILDDKVGEPYEEKKLITEYRERKKGTKPPYCAEDDKKPEYSRKRGDIAVWLEMMDKAKSAKKHLIFVTGDTKENWWLTKGSTRPNPALIEEFESKTDQIFFMYSPVDFNKQATKHLNLDLSAEFEEETKQIQTKNEELSYSIRHLRFKDFLESLESNLSETQEWHMFQSLCNMYVYSHTRAAHVARWEANLSQKSKRLIYFGLLQPDQLTLPFRSHFNTLMEKFSDYMESHNESKVTIDENNPT